jgi:hypothetical protein
LVWSDIALRDFDGAAERARSLLELARGKRSSRSENQARGLLGIALTGRGDADAAQDLRACLEHFGALDDGEISACSDLMLEVLNEAAHLGARPDLTTRFTAAREGRLVATPVRAGP